jgi:uncharacterized membrane protein YcaP (DUF421 family)
MNPYFDIVLRSIVIYFFVILAIRLFGKKELAQLSVIDLVFILLISNSVQNAMVGPDTSLIGGILAAGSLFIMNFVLKYFLFRSKSFSHMLQGTAVMLVHEGKVMEDHLKKERISMEELEAAIREHGVNSVAEVNLAVLEADGNISILSKNYQKRSVRRRKAHKVISKST